MASHTISSHLRNQPLSFFVQSGLILTQVAGSPLPPSTDDEKFHPEVRSLTGDGPLEDWEIAILILGALFGIMILGALGGICEVMLSGKIKESNAEADSKLENIGKRSITDEEEGGKMDGGGGEGSDGVIDPARYSWQPERMTTGLSDDSTLAGSDPGASQSDVSRGEQAMAADGASQDYAQTSEQYVAWDGGSLPHPDSSQFVIDDVDSPGYGGPRDNSQSYEAYPGHLNPPPAMPKNNAYQNQDTADHQYWNEGGDGTSYPDSSQARDGSTAPDGSTEQSTLPPPGAYSGEGYSPAVMPDSADYLSEYRQSQLYLQQGDDWYTTASATYGAPAGTAH
ncbi:hypothetical protein F5883DRAFT_554712 [Diaporthe sp. PMI_573]|nr:hypothetical protein F5883DRAFT_554712 [Diaporthaceae sp. PMI_573]